MGYINHSGIKGQKKGIRRFQYANKSYTPEGNERYRPKKGFINEGTVASTGAGLGLAFTGAIIARKYLMNKASGMTLGTIAKTTITTGSKYVTAFLNSPIGALSLPLLTMGAVAGTISFANWAYDKLKKDK